MEASLEAAATRAIEACQTELLDLINNPQRRWESLDTKKGIVRSRLETGDGINIVRSSGTINRPAQQVVDALWDYSRKREWDKQCMASTLVQDFPSGVRVLYNAFKSPWPVADRDFCFAMKIIRMGNHTLIPAINVVTPQCPAKDGFERGEMRASGFYVESLSDANTCRLTYVVNVDPKGLIPNMVTNKVQEEQSMNVHKLRKFLGDREKRR
ncbi:unnamed protein product [Blepharisma stoltei]|uniref:START domain-containing protein n=1 Tax=Blepharisma stoltei TaxID=1481888 RepID=A0AAU9JWH7_9CILI|nr:unnamed protein product [Blepharisma stoltei]